MNLFVEILEREQDFTLGRLKQIFRQVSKRTHPDTGQADQEAFIKLKEEYEEALKLLMADSLKDKKRLSPAEARKELLKSLYDFGIRIFTKKADALLVKMIGLSKDYDPQIAELLSRYNETMYKERDSWKAQAYIYYPHNIFITCIRQLFMYYNSGSALHKKLFCEYKKAMEGWTGNLRDDYKEILRSLYAWLERELEEERFEYYG